jgi:hypothetical protein
VRGRLSRIGDAWASTDSAGRRHLADIPPESAPRYDLDVPGASGPSQAQSQRFRVGDRVVVTDGYDGYESDWLRGGSGYIGTIVDITADWARPPGQRRPEESHTTSEGPFGPTSGSILRVLTRGAGGSSRAAHDRLASARVLL